MKKWLFIALFLCPLSLEAEIMRSSKEEPVSIKYVKENVTTSTNVILIDLSSTSVFPHKQTGSINIADVFIGVDKLAASSGTVKLGVVTGISESTGSVTWFFEHSFTESAALTEKERTSPDSWLYRLKVGSNGQTPYVLSNDTTLANGMFQVGRALESVGGVNTDPGVGDIILNYTNNGNGTNQVDLNVEAKYNSD